MIRKATQQGAPQPRRVRSLTYAKPLLIRSAIMLSAKPFDEPFRQFDFAGADAFDAASRFLVFSALPSTGPPYSPACKERTNPDSPIWRSRLSRSAARIAHTSSKARRTSRLMTT